MADTTNFGWTKPTVGGDNNAWGTELNTLFDDIDADLQIAADAIETLETDVAALQLLHDDQVAQQTLYVSAEAFQPNDDEDDIIYGHGSGASLEGESGHSLWAALPPLPVGATLNAVSLYADKNGATSVTATVFAVSLTGVVTTLGSGVNSSTGVQPAAASGLNHVVGAEFLKVKASQSGGGRILLYGLKIVYTPATPA